MRFGSGLVLALLVYLGPLVAHAQLPTLPPPTPDQTVLREIYKELVGINTTDSVGDNTAAARAMAARLKAGGFADADMQIIVPPGAPRKGNLVARLAGTGARKPLLLLAHLDVVEAKREDWERDPFKLVEEGGYFYARGSVDAKAMAAIFVANLIRYKKEGYRPERPDPGPDRGRGARLELAVERGELAPEAPSAADRGRARAQRCTAWSRPSGVDGSEAIVAVQLSVSPHDFARAERRHRALTTAIPLEPATRRALGGPSVALPKALAHRFGEGGR